MKKPVVRLIVAVAATAACTFGGVGSAMAATPATQPGAVSLSAATQDSTLSYLDVATIAVQRVQSSYPLAKLLESSGFSASGPTDDVNKITSWKFVFQLPGNKTAIIESTGWGTFAPPVVINRPWTEDYVIDWTPQSYLDITAADAILKKAGYVSAYSSVTMRAPLGPKHTEPYYIFNFPDGSHTAVGLVDGNVTAFQ